MQRPNNPCCHRRHLNKPDSPIKHDSKKLLAYINKTNTDILTKRYYNIHIIPINHTEAYEKFTEEYCLLYLDQAECLVKYDDAETEFR
jgi:hypothetical protein